MATCYVTEYYGAARGGNRDTIPAGKEPALATQLVTFTTAVSSAAFDGGTNLVRVFPSASCHVAFGPAPTATINSTKIAGNAAEFFGVEPGHKISIYDGVS